MRKTIAVPAGLILAAAVPFLVPTIAVGQVAAPAPMITTAPFGWLSIADIAARLSEAGWTVLKIEAEISDGNYDACLLGSDGSLIEARIDPVSGEILSREVDSCIDGYRDDRGGHRGDGDEDRHGSRSGDDGPADSRD